MTQIKQISADKIINKIIFYHNHLCHLRSIGFGVTK